MKDKSPQGFYDEDIIPLLDKINAKEEYETTSSCSGRITLMRGVKKGEAVWILKSHEEINYKEITNKLEDDYLRFICEPLIVHVKCNSLESASKLLQMLHENGFKKSCIISTKNFILEINDTGKIETLLNNKVPENYIQDLVLEANRRLKNTKKNIKKLEGLFSQ